MTRFHFLLIRAFYPALLFAGVAFATSGIVITVLDHAEPSGTSTLWWERYGYAVSHAGVGIALLLLTVAYALAFWRRPVTVEAPLAYMLSYVLCAFSFGVTLILAAKAESPAELFRSIEYGAYFIVPSLVLSTLGLIFSTHWKM